MDSAAGQGEIRWTVPRSQCAPARALARALATELPLIALGDDHTLGDGHALGEDPPQP